MEGVGGRNTALVPKLEAEHSRWVGRVREVYRASIELQRSATLELEEDIDRLARAGQDQKSMNSASGGA